MAQIDDLGVALLADVEVSEQLSIAVEERGGGKRGMQSFSICRRRGVVRYVAYLVVAARDGRRHALERALVAALATLVCA